VSCGRSSVELNDARLPPPIASAVRDGHVRVATFNLRHGADDSGRVRLLRLARFCAELDVDLLGLQEVSRGRRHSMYVDQAVVVARRLRARHVAGPAMTRGWLRRYGNALLVRGRVDAREVIDLPRAANREPRSAVIADIRVGAVPMSVAVTHLQHQPKRFRHLEHDAPAQLEAVLGALAGRPGPRLLLGDLNLGPEVAGPILERAGYTMAMAGPTFPAGEPRRTLDYVAVAGLVVTGAWVSERPPVSDHRALVAELALDG
jgi:endonuclease/exonuclease/phosphatase family metal-dependent hydrolase